MPPLVAHGGPAAESIEAETPVEPGVPEIPQATAEPAKPDPGTPQRPPEVGEAAQGIAPKPEPSPAQAEVETQEAAAPKDDPAEAGPDGDAGPAPDDLPDPPPVEPPPPAAAPTLITHAALLDHAVTRPDDEAPGRVSDLWVDADSGAVVGLQVIFGQETVWVGPRVLAWEPAQDASGFALRLPARPTVLGAEALHDLFGGHELTQIEGRVTELTYDPELPEGGLTLKLHDAENLLHRVHVAPAAAVRRSLPGLVQGSTLTVEGAITRDGRGKLCVASRLVQGGKNLPLRGAEGELLLPQILGEGLVSARSLVAPDDVDASQGEAWRATGWMLLRKAMRIESVVEESKAGRRFIPWAERRPGG